MRLWLGGGLRGGMLLAADLQAAAGTDPVHAEAQQSLQSHAGKKKTSRQCLQYHIQTAKFE